MPISVLPTPTDVEVPHCSHGPALLFSRNSSRGLARHFYGCAACREKQGCPLHVPADENGKPLLVSKCRDKPEAAAQARKALLRLSRHLSRQGHADLAFCRTCCLFVPKDHHGVGHEVVIAPHRWLRQPTRLLRPRTTNSENAQFLFDASALCVLLGAAKRSGASALLCLGCPRLHEAALRVRQRRGASWPDSALLDLDERFEAFFGPGRFARYNMFSHHVFGSRCALQRLKSRNKVLVVCDPPYGGLLQPLSRSLQQLSNELGPGVVLGTILVMPYFMEKKIAEFMPELKICDFPIAYENHRKFGESSAARLFSNLPVSVLTPSSRSAHRFRFCGRCQRYSALSNRHCKLCDSCPTKHGPTYRHCSRCGRCVKPSWIHCFVCDFCVQPLQHRCASTESRTCDG